MHCFNHLSEAAVGVCKGCGRGVCRICMDVSGRDLACSEACAVDAAELREMNQRAKSIYGIGASAKRRQPMGALMFAGFALVFGGLAAYTYLHTGRIDGFALTFAALFAALGVAMYRRAKDLKLNC